MFKYYFTLQKSKNKDLTELQKLINKGIGSVRVKVEPAFNGVKVLKIARNKIRLKTYQVRDQVFKIAAALHNLRLSFRTLQNNS